LPASKYREQTALARNERTLAMNVAQTENLLMLAFPLVFGFAPAFLDTLKIRSHVPNLIVALFVAAVVALSSPVWLGNSRMENVVVVFALLGIPAILVSYGLSRLLFWAIGSVLKALAN
jgi:cell division protein FtsW (lipid II flippase)